MRAIVSVLRSGVERGSVSVLPRVSEFRDSEVRGLSLVESLAGMISSAANCDTICVDDRFVNSRSVCTALDGTEVPVVSVAEILQYLRSQQILSDVEYWREKHKLRNRGFVYISVEADELLHWFKATEVREGHMTEVLSYERFARQ